MYHIKSHDQVFMLDDLSVHLSIDKLFPSHPTSSLLNSLNLSQIPVKRAGSLAVAERIVGKLRPRPRGYFDPCWEGLKLQFLCFSPVSNKATLKTSLKKHCFQVQPSHIHKVLAKVSSFAEAELCYEQFELGHNKKEVRIGA